jgi:UDP-glucose 4-epimerase
MRALVTGGAGFIGRSLVNELISRGIDVLVVDSGFTGNLEKVNKKSQLIVQDIENYSVNDWRNMLIGIDYVFHLAAQKYNTKNVKPEKIISSNVNSTFNLARASSMVGIKRFVFTSSLYAYGGVGPNAMKESDLPQPDTLYGVSKITGEHILKVAERDQGLMWNAARLFFIYGPDQYAGSGYKSVIVKNFERIKKGLPPIIVGDGKQSLDYVYISDAVNALLMMAFTEKTSLTLNVSTGESVSILQLIDYLKQVSGVELDVEYAPADWTHNTN